MSTERLNGLIVERRDKDCWSTWRLYFTGEMVGRVRDALRYPIFANAVVRGGSVGADYELHLDDVPVSLLAVLIAHAIDYDNTLSLQAEIERLRPLDGWDAGPMFPILPLDDGSLDHPWHEALAAQADALFDECGVRVASYQSLLFGVAVDSAGDDLIAALVAGAPYGDPFSGLMFSLVVHPDFRRRNIGRRLVLAFLEYCRQDRLPAMAHVVNEDMIPLLEDVGFTRTGQDPIWCYEL